MSASKNSENNVNSGLHEEKIWVINGWSLDEKRHCLIKDKNIVRLEPKIIQLLAYLAARAGKPISREQLLEEVWPSTVVSDESLTNAVNKIRKAFGDSRQKPQVIETIPKMGYRFIAAVSSEAVATNTRTTNRGMPWAGTALIILVLVGMYVTKISQDDGEQEVVPAQSYVPPLSTININQKQKPSLVILPFENLSSDPDQAYFVEGLTDDLIEVIARRPDIFIISRESSYFYLGSAQGTEKIARQLQVRYALQGDVRFIADRIRISTKFHDAEASKLLWEETFEGKLDDIFSIQDSLIDKTLDALLDRSKDQISGVQQTQRANNIEAYDRYLYGRKYFYLYASKIDNNKARELFLKAIEYDPNFANAYAMLAWTHVYEAMNGWSEDREASLERAYVLSEQAIQIQPALPLAYFVRGLVNRERKEYIKAIVDVEKALQYDPNYANAHMLMGTLLYYAGQPEESIQTIRKAMRLNPHHPYNYSFHLGQGLYILRRYQEAIEALESGLETNPSSLRTQVWLVAALAQFGDTDEAAWQVELLLLENPDLSLQKIQHLFPFKDTKDLDHFLEGLRIAGLSQTLLIE